MVHYRRASPVSACLIGWEQMHNRVWQGNPAGIVSRLTAIIAAVVFLSSPATLLAQPKKPPAKKKPAKKKPAQKLTPKQLLQQQLYNKGLTQYNLRKFRKAIEYYEAGYKVLRDPVFLFNIGQAYRLMSECQKAIFFYKRFIQETPRASLRKMARGKINETKTTCKPKPATPKDRDRDGLLDDRDQCPTKPEDKDGFEDDDGCPDKDNDKDGISDTDDDCPDKPEDKDDFEDDDGCPEDGSATDKAHAGPRSKIFAQALVAPSFLFIGERLKVPTQVSLAMQGGYRFFERGKLSLEAGGIASLTIIPWENATSDGKKTGRAYLNGYVANIGASYRTLPKLDLTLDVGLGVQLFLGLTKQGNVFTQDGRSAEGVVTMFFLRMAPRVAYYLTPKAYLTVAPAISYSPRVKDVFEPSIKRIVRLELFSGFGLRF